MSINIKENNSKYDVLDSNGVKDIKIEKNATYRGPIDIIYKLARPIEFKHGVPLGATTVGINNTDAPLPRETKYYTAWNDLDAQEIYLNTKPTCYLIVGKPGSGAYSLGEALAKRLKCIHLSPLTILRDELEQQGPTGICLDFNMRHNMKCIFNILLLILKKKLESPVVQHRGYILTGFPLISNKTDSRLVITSQHGEEALNTSSEICNFLVNNIKRKEKKGSIVQKTNTSSFIEMEEEELTETLEEEHEHEEAIEEQEELPKEFPKSMLEFCSNIVFNQKTHICDNESTFLKQFEEIFNLDLSPDVIINITSPDCDLITKKSSKYFNYLNSQIVMEPFNNNPVSESRWPSKYTVKDFINPFDSHIFNPKYMCRQPYNFKLHSTQQMCNYKNTIKSAIDKKLEEYGYNAIKLDSRMSLHEMIHNAMERLILIPNNSVLIPEPLYLDEPSDNIEDFTKSIEQLNIINSCGVNFHRYMSPWNFRCPVELRKRKSMKGNSKFAVTFFKHVYCLSSFDAMLQFCKNPHPYLKLEYLEPTCRIIIVGTKSSGKSMIAQCLSWIFNTPIICYKTFLEQQKSKKYFDFSKSILSSISAKIEDDRFSQWQSAEIERYQKIEMWYDTTASIIQEYLWLQSNMEPRQNETISLNQTEQRTNAIVSVENTDLTDNIKRLEYLQSELSFLPFENDEEQLKRALDDKQFLCQFIPAELKISARKPEMPMIGDEDVSKAVAEFIVANDLQNEVEPTNEELINEIINITSSDNESNKTDLDSKYSKYIIDGFTTNPECWEYLITAKSLPDYTIALVENKEIDSQLAKYYFNIENSVKNYVEKFSLAQDPLITQKMISGEVPDKINSSLKIAHDNEQVVRDQTEDETTQMNTIFDETAFTTALSESIDKFKEEWDVLKTRLDEFYKGYIEVELETKSDVEIIDEVLLKLRKCYFAPCEPCYENESRDSISDTFTKDVMTNKPSFVSETNIYCPVTYYDYGVLWEGKKDFSLRLNNQIYRFCNEEFSVLFQKDPGRYQVLKTPYKKLPPLRICVIGCIGLGKTTLSKYIAKELGLIHIDFVEILNEELVPKHFKKVGRKYENSFTDNPIDDEGAVEYQMDEENMNASLVNVLYNETEIRSIIYNYLEKGISIPSTLMHKILKKLWFEEPFVKTGFVLDGYPKTPNDVNDMLTFLCIPDLIIELEGTSVNTIDRLSPEMINTWKLQLNEAKANARVKLEIEKKEWMNFITKNVVGKLILEDLLDNVPHVDNVLAPTMKPLSTSSMESVIIDAHPSGSFNVDANLFTIYNQIVEEFPEPEDQNIWEKSDEAREKIDSRLESVFETESENIQALKDLLSEQNIKLETVDATKSFEKVMRTALSKLNDLRNRNISFLEETYVIDLDVAEILLGAGFYFQSKFHRMCPVQIYDSPHIILNPYKLSKKKGTLYPVIHRSYIYFVSSIDNLIKFRNNPIKYADSNTIIEYRHHPLKIAIIGPPKSGKSMLAEKISKQYGLLCISRGKAIRDVLNNLSWTKLASKMNSVLIRGEILNYDLLMSAVQTEAIDHRIVTHGFVLDGFPETPSEGIELCKNKLYPNIIFDISSTKAKIIENCRCENYLDIIKQKPHFPEILIEKRYSIWKENCNKIRDWIDEDYQNIYVLDGNSTRWKCLQDALKIIANFSKEMHYVLSAGKLSAVPVEVLCISNDDFRQNMSNYKNICPICFHQNIFRNGGPSVNKKGVVLYDNTFFWVCSEHMKMAIDRPHIYLCNKKVYIPEIPAVIKTIDPILIYENGICIVTYAENLPAQKVKKGSEKIAVNFEGKIYLFCSEICLEKFLRKPYLYKDVVVFKETKLFPKITIDKLPDLGYLEQTISTILTEACCHVNVIRPKYPGLDIQTSGLIYVALYLKIHNSKINKDYLTSYKKSMRRYEARCKLLLDIGLKLRSMTNPFAQYLECCSVKRIDSGTVEKPSSVSSSINS